MNWNLKVRNQTVTLKTFEPLRAVYPTDEFRSTAKLPDYRSNFGEVIAGEHVPGPEVGLPPTDRRLFERNGWWFVSPNVKVLEAATLREPVGDNGIAREIFISESGAMFVATNLATVKLPPDLSEEQAEQVMRDDGLTTIRKLGFALNLYEVQLPSGIPLPEVINRLQNSGHYLWAEPSLLQSFKPKEAVPTDPEFRKQWQHRNTGLDDDGFPLGIAGEDLDSLRAWEVTKGAGVRIAIIDFGMQIDHPDLKDGIVGGGFFLTDQASGISTFFPLIDGMTDFPISHHGTFCMGLAAARINGAGQQDQGGCGIAPEAELIAIACPSQQLATQTTLADAIHFAVEPSDFNPGADVISCSVDTNNPLFTVLSDAINYAATKGRKKNGISLGVPIFWAVSNDTASILNDPVCCLPQVIAVGKYDRRGLWVEGAFGNQVAFLAPGFDVFSTTSGGDNIIDDGTSFATPLAAGVAALLLSVHPNLTAAQVRQKLIQSCDRMNGVVGHHPKFGFGKLNAFKAVS